MTFIIFNEPINNSNFKSKWDPYKLAKIHLLGILYSYFRVLAPNNRIEMEEETVDT